MNDSDPTNSQLSSDSISCQSIATSTLELMPSPDLGNQGDPLFPGSIVSSAHFNIAFMSLVQRHNLTYSCETDLLQLLSMVLPSPNKVPSSSSNIIGRFANLKNDGIIQHFCGVCSTPLDSGLLCTRPHCTSSQSRPSVFIRIPVAAQLMERFQGLPWTESVLYCILCVCVFM